MTNPTPYNGRVPLERLIDARFEAQREHMDTRFDALAEAFREHCTENSEDKRDHEDRLRALEKLTPWRNIAEFITGVVAVVAMALGLTD